MIGVMVIRKEIKLGYRARGIIMKNACLPINPRVLQPRHVAIYSFISYSKFYLSITENDYVLINSKLEPLGEWIARQIALLESQNS